MAWLAHMKTTEINLRLPNTCSQGWSQEPSVVGTAESGNKYKGQLGGMWNTPGSRMEMIMEEEHNEADSQEKHGSNARSVLKHGLGWTWDLEDLPNTLDDM